MQNICIKTLFSRTSPVSSEYTSSFLVKHSKHPSSFMQFYIEQHVWRWRLTFNLQAVEMEADGPSKAKQNPMKGLEVLLIWDIRQLQETQTCKEINGRTLPSGAAHNKAMMECASITKYYQFESGVEKLEEPTDCPLLSSVSADKASCRFMTTMSCDIMTSLCVSPGSV